MNVLKTKSWQGHFPLSPFSGKLRAIKSAPRKRRILIITKFRMSLNTIETTYIWISHIMSRVDNNLNNQIGFMNLTRRISRGERVSADELPPSNPWLTHIDITSLFIFISILMDDVTRFLEYLFIGAFKPKFGSFDKFKKNLKNYEGRNLDDFNIIIQDTDWYDELKTIRDKHVIHRGDRDSGTGMVGDAIGIHLRYYEKGVVNEKFISNIVIDILCDNVYTFLKDLNDFLCENFDHLPIEVIRVSPQKPE